MSKKSKRLKKSNNQNQSHSTTPTAKILSNTENSNTTNNIKNVETQSNKSSTNNINNLSAIDSQKLMSLLPKVNIENLPKPEPYVNPASKIPITCTDSQLNELMAQKTTQSTQSCNTTTNTQTQPNSNGKWVSEAMVASDSSLISKNHNTINLTQNQATSNEEVSTPTSTS